jgi:hypothetical protein
MGAHDVLASRQGEGRRLDDAADTCLLRLEMGAPVVPFVPLP